MSRRGEVRVLRDGRHLACGRDNGARANIGAFRSEAAARKALIRWLKWTSIKNVVIPTRPTPDVSEPDIGQYVDISTSKHPDTFTIVDRDAPRWVFGGKWCMDGNGYVNNTGAGADHEYCG